MANTAKYRSIHAFKEYGAAKSFGLGADDDESADAKRPLSTLRVLDAVKQSGDGLRRRELAQELGTDVEAVEDAVLHLLKDGFVKIRRGSSPEDDLIVA